MKQFIRHLHSLDCQLPAVVGAVGAFVLTPALALAQVPEGAAFINEAQYTYVDPSNGSAFAGKTNSLAVSNDLIDSPGASSSRLLGCAGERLENYRGFSMALYAVNPADPTATELGRLVSLTPTQELTSTPSNGGTAGVQPNVLNTNPFFLSNADGGAYNFLLDSTLGQTAAGTTYLLVIQPPANSVYVERRIKLDILDSGEGNNGLRYRATSLDGQPIAQNGATTITQVEGHDTASIGPSLRLLQPSTLLCQPNQIVMTKAADRATAEPGDVVIYRLAIRNQSDVALQGLVLRDRLPQGFRLLPDSVQAEVAGERVEISTELLGDREALLPIPMSLPMQSVMTVIYAVQITPDAARGSGQNVALIEGQRADNNFSVQQGPAIHSLQVRPGITSDSGLLLGRVFEDHNRDGEQQRGEPGLPQAVIYLQDGNRVVTDEQGLFSVANVPPGYHSGILDLASVPGYQLAPNDYRREFKSEARLVRLAPGSMARMNFPVIALPVESPVARPEEAQ